ncbi:MAG: hypothetical protein P8X91_09675 [Candidatus Bathyarchaeota archaeon]
MQKGIRKIFFKKRILPLIISSLIISIIFSILIQVQFAQTNTLTIESISPASGPQGVKIYAYVTGTGFTNETRIILRRGTFTVNAIMGSGEIATLLDGFTALSEGPEFEKLTVTKVTPSVVERGKEVWIELEGSGFIFEENGSQIFPYWEIGKPLFTLIRQPERTKTYSLGQNHDWLNVINSNLMQLKIYVDPSVPPQNLRFTLFNPPENYLFSQPSEESLWINQTNPNQIASFIIEVVKGQDENETETSSNSTCVIATAAYGSEVEPEVQFLRDFRDSKVLSTYSGSNFMQAFNAFYYSWSPSVANVIRGNDFLRVITRGMISPLLGTLFVSWNIFEFLQFSPELAIIIAGFVAGILLGAIYIGFPLTIASKLSKRLSEKLEGTIIVKSLFLLVVLGFVLTIVGFIINGSIFSMLGSALLVLSSMALSTNLTFKALSWVGRKTQKLANPLLKKIKIKIANN